MLDFDTIHFLPGCVSFASAGFSTQKKMKNGRGASVLSYRMRPLANVEKRRFRRRKKCLTNRLHRAIILRHSRSAPEYRGVEQLEARRAHNPEVVGSSPASATKKSPEIVRFQDFFLRFRGRKVRIKILQIRRKPLDPYSDP